MSGGHLASVDGEITATSDATVSLPDDGLYRGDGVFEVIRLYQGRPFALAEHLDRLDRSAAAIELAIERPQLEAEIDALLRRLAGADGQLRIILTRAGRRLIAAEPLPEHLATLRLAVVTYSPSVILNGVKSLSYAANMQATRIAQGGGADEALLVRPDGIVLEAPTSAIFWSSAEGGLHTPALSAGILESITRSKLIAELHVEEGEFGIDDVRGAREVFLASTTREVQAVAAIDDVRYDAPGPHTREAQAAFARRLEAELAGSAEVS